MKLPDMFGADYPSTAHEDEQQVESRVEAHDIAFYGQDAPARNDDMYHEYLDFLHKHNPRLYQKIRSLS